MIMYDLLKLDGQTLEGDATTRVHQLIRRLLQVYVQLSGEMDVETVVIDLFDNRKISLDFTRVDNPEIARPIGWIVQRREAEDKFIYILYREIHTDLPCASMRADLYGAIERISENCVFSQTKLVDWVLSNFLGNSIDQTFRWERLLDHVTADVK
jgi:hypothetical protein